MICELYSGTRRRLCGEDIIALCDRLSLLTRDDVVIVGDCPTGVDEFVARWCKANAGPSLEVHHANWNAFGDSAGPLRNGRMVLTALRYHNDATPMTPVTLRAFAMPSHAGSPGTMNFISQARGAGIDTTVRFAKS